VTTSGRAHDSMSTTAVPASRTSRRLRAIAVDHLDLQHVVVALDVGAKSQARRGLVAAETAGRQGLADPLDHARIAGDPHRRLTRRR
jgi:hypothetical protein